MTTKATIPPIKESTGYPLDFYSTKDKDSGYNSEIWRPLTKEKVLQDLAISRRQIEEGKCIDLLTAVKEIREEFGL